MKALSPQERKALAGITLVTLFIAYSVYEIGRRNFWFEAQNIYHTHVKDADGLRVGSVVTVSGLRVGEVSALDVDEENNIAVTVEVRRAVASRLRKDSVASIFRAFIIGEKRIDLIPGSPSEPELPNGATLPGKDTTDLAEFVTGKKLAEIMNEVEMLIGGLNNAVKNVDELFGKYHDGSLNKTMAMVDPALANFIKLSDDMLVMTREMKKKSKDLPVFVENGAAVFSGMRGDFFDNHLAKNSFEKLNLIMTPLSERTQLIEGLLANMEDLSRDLKANPRYGRQVLDAVGELTITLKALQKTWFLEDKTDEVKAQQKKAREKQKAKAAKKTE